MIFNKNKDVKINIKNYKSLFKMNINYNFFIDIFI